MQILVVMQDKRKGFPSIKFNLVAMLVSSNKNNLKST